VGRLLPDVL